MDGHRGSVVSADGTRVGFVTDGVGRSLLMVHGGMCSSARWEPLWPLLVKRYRVTAMDRRGRASSGDGLLPSVMSGPTSRRAALISVGEPIEVAIPQPVTMSSVLFEHITGQHGAVKAPVIAREFAPAIPSDDIVVLLVTGGQTGRH